MSFKTSISSWICLSKQFDFVLASQFAFEMQIWFIFDMCLLNACIH